MSYDANDSAQDEYYSQLLEEISKDAISGFQTDRLQSYYLSHRDIARDPTQRYWEAALLMTVNAGAALVLFVTATEVAIKAVLLRPVIAGLVHNEAVAELISDLAIQHNGLDRFKPILAKILAAYGQIDFTEFRIEGHDKTLWEELARIQNARNGLVHRAEPVSLEDANLAQSVAVMVLGNWLPSVLSGLGLGIGNHDGLVERV